jgi:hypothetical protein
MGKEMAGIYACFSRRTAFSLSSVICHRFTYRLSHLSSAIDSVIYAAALQRLFPSNVSLIPFGASARTLPFS